MKLLTHDALNFLAHFYLSGDEEHLILGNFLGDFLKNRDVARLPRPVQEGVRLHRAIDFFTDHHPAVRLSTGALREVHRKYAPVILDVLHDFILAKNWDRYSEVSLRTFTSSVYKILKKNLSLMPDYLQDRVPLMIADDWLTRYGTEEGLRFTFDRMKRRSSFPDYFDHAVESLRQHYKTLDTNFNVFFPEVIQAVKDWELRSE